MNEIELNQRINDMQISLIFRPGEVVLDAFDYEKRRRENKVIEEVYYDALLMKEMP